MRSIPSVSVWLAEAEPASVINTFATRLIRCFRPDEPDGESEAFDFVSVADSCSSRRHEADGRQETGIASEQELHPGGHPIVAVPERESQKRCQDTALQMNRKSGVDPPDSKRCTRQMSMIA